MIRPIQAKSGPIGLKRYHVSDLLRLAVKYCKSEMVSLLLAHDTAVNGGSSIRPMDTPISFASQRGSLSLVNLILDPRWEFYGDPYQPDQALIYSARCHCNKHQEDGCEERIAIINLLLPRVETRFLQRSRQDALSEACTWSCVNISMAILSAGAEVNPNPLRTPGLAGKMCLTPPIDYAASHGHVELVEHLLSPGGTAGQIFPATPCDCFHRGSGQCGSDGVSF